jgi:hypothetical protein
MKYSGIDLHSNNSVVTVTDEQDRVVVQKRLPNDLAQLEQFKPRFRKFGEGGFNEIIDLCLA